jgi:hypothetical protein
MSIRAISSTTPGLGYGTPHPGGPGVRRPVVEDPSGLSRLTWEDRELVGAMFGPDRLATGRDDDLPAFVWLVVEDRRTGRLPAGSEITSSYLHAVRAGYPVEANPLTEQTLAAALAFLARRGQGATVDIRA